MASRVCSGNVTWGKLPPRHQSPHPSSQVVELASRNPQIPSVLQGGLIFHFLSLTNRLSRSPWLGRMADGGRRLGVLAETSRILPSLPLWPWLRAGAPGLLPVGAGGWSRLCLPQEASQAAVAATGPCPGLGDVFFFFPVLQLGPFIIGKKENDQASRPENKET